MESEDGTQVYYEETQENWNRAFYDTGSGTWRDTTRVVSLGWGGTDSQSQELPDGTRAMVSVTAVTEYGGQAPRWSWRT